MMGSDCIHSDGAQAVYQRRDDVLAAAAIRAMLAAARGLDQQPVSVPRASVEHLPSDDTEGGEA